MELKDIKFDKRNYRKHSDSNKALIKKSLQETGLGRSIVIDSENEIVAGNGVVSQLPEGTKIKVVETDGSELVVVKRTDLKTQDPKRKKLALMDNSASNNVEWDYDNLQADFDLDELPDFGLEDLPKFLEEETEVLEDEVPEEVETKCKKGDIWQLGEHRFGKEMPGWIRKRISDSLKGRKISETWRKKNSDSHKGLQTLGKNPKAKSVLCINNGKKYSCMKEAALDLNISIGALYNAVRKDKPIKNYTFKREDRLCK